MTAIHPVADLFPMLPDEDLDELAADIRERGLLQPIVVDTDGVVLDGRNRLAACQRAGVEPSFTTYDGDDPVGFVLSVNIARRSLSKGQAAVIVAEAWAAFPEETIREFSGKHGLSAPTVAKATTVLEYAPELASRVVSGSPSLNEAYKEARRRKEAADSAEVKLAELRKEYPDLADLVEDGRFDIAAAMVAAKKRRDEEERQRRVSTDLLCTHLVVIAQLRDSVTAEQYTPDMALPGRAVTREVIDDARIAIQQIEQTWKERDLP